MTTPKEKAKKLFQEYFLIIGAFSYAEKTELAKKCALLFVYELLYSVTFIDNTDEEITKIVYYNDVMEEIKKL
jgi:hypothetical protein